MFGHVTLSGRILNRLFHHADSDSKKTRLIYGVLRPLGIFFTETICQSTRVYSQKMSRLFDDVNYWLRIKEGLVFLPAGVIYKRRWIQSGWGNRLNVVCF